MVDALQQLSAFRNGHVSSVHGLQGRVLRLDQCRCRFLVRDLMAYGLQCSVIIMQCNIMRRRREYNRRVKEIVERSWVSAEDDAEEEDE